MLREVFIFFFRTIWTQWSTWRRRNTCMSSYCCKQKNKIKRKYFQPNLPLFSLDASSKIYLLRALVCFFWKWNLVIALALMCLKGRRHFRNKIVQFWVLPLLRLSDGYLFGYWELALGWYYINLGVTNGLEVLAPWTELCDVYVHNSRLCIFLYSGKYLHILGQTHTALVACWPKRPNTVQTFLEDFLLIWWAGWKYC